jgi:glycerol-3-phosphate dehydrogenase (NAD(P)+)
MMQRVTIFGAGAWGTAIAQLLADNGHAITMWAKQQKIADEITLQHTNATYLPGITLPNNITATTSIDEAINGADWLVEAIPVAYLRAQFERIKKSENFSPSIPWLLLSKGIEQHSLLLPSALLDSVFEKDLPKVVLAGPTFAKDLAAGAFTATMLGSLDNALLAKAQRLLENSYFKTYQTNDILGIQVGGAIKNIIALAAGLAHGAGHGENMHAFLLTKGFAELTSIIKIYGGQAETSTTLAGLGDLILTASSVTSKNFRAGMLLGQGLTREQLLEHLPVLPEGFNTVQSVIELAKLNNAQLPLCTMVYNCLFNKAPFTIP